MLIYSQKIIYIYGNVLIYFDFFQQEHCRKYSKAQESFLPWLSDTEERLLKLPPTTFTKKEVEKQLRELQQIRNDIWKR